MGFSPPADCSERSTDMAFTKPRSSHVRSGAADGAKNAGLSSRSTVRKISRSKLPACRPGGLACLRARRRRGASIPTEVQMPFARDCGAEHTPRISLMARIASCVSMADVVAPRLPT